jgi:hypothetical protein
VDEPTAHFRPEEQVTELIKKKVDETIPKAVIQSLNASGFPFQTAIRHEIPRHNGWAVHASEYPWLDGMNRDNFLDIVYIVSFRTHDDRRPSKFIVLADNMRSAIKMAWEHGGADFQSRFDKSTGQAQEMKEGALRVL